MKTLGQHRRAAREKRRNEFRQSDQQIADQRRDNGNDRFAASFTLTFGH